MTDYDGKIRSISGDVLVPATTTADAFGIAIACALNEKRRSYRRRYKYYKDSE